MMNVTQYRNAKSFLDKVQAYLEQDEALNGLILGISFRLAERPSRRRNRPYLAVVEDAGAIMATAVMTPPHKLALYSHQADCQAAMMALAHDLNAGDLTVPTVFGVMAAAHSFAAAWEKITGMAATPGAHQRVFELRRVNDLPLAPGQMRPAAADDFEQVVNWITAFYQELNMGQDFPSAGMLARQHIHDGSLFVWQDGTEIVSMAAKARPTRNGIALNKVYTPPEQRGRGYATSLVATLSRQLLDEGWQFCTLFTDLANPVSNHIYEKIGYTAVADFHEYYFLARS